MYSVADIDHVSLVTDYEWVFFVYHVFVVVVVVVVVVVFFI